jgi:hypothetical protein
MVVGMSDFDGAADDVIDLAVVELGRRLQDEPGEIPAGTLVKLAELANKTAERRAAAAAELEQQQRDTSVLDVVRSTNLPVDRKRALIEKERARLRGLLAELDELEVELDG